MEKKKKKTPDPKWTGTAGLAMSDLTSGSPALIEQGLDTVARHGGALELEAILFLLDQDDPRTQEGGFRAAAKQLADAEVRAAVLTEAVARGFTHADLDTGIRAVGDDELSKTLAKVRENLRAKKAGRQACHLGSYLRGRAETLIRREATAIKEAGFVPDETLEQEASFWMPFLTSASLSLASISDMLDSDLTLIIALALLTGTDHSYKLRYRDDLSNIAVELLLTSEMEFMGERVIELAVKNGETLEKNEDVLLALAIAVVRCAAEDELMKGDGRQKWLSALGATAAFLSTAHADVIREEYRKVEEKIPKPLRPRVKAELGL